MTYQDIKTWFEENKQKIILVICFVLVFVIGFGTGRYYSEDQRNQVKPQSQTNYNIKADTQATKPAGEGTAEEPAQATEAAQKTPAVLGTNADKQCPVKGNRSSKIYHVPGGAFYATLKSPQCFQTEAEAVAAGYRKSGR